jgi:catechol 2,3-dioxygenase-like lactoylglutathione lyase family enzyme
MSERVFHFAAASCLALVAAAISAWLPAGDPGVASPRCEVRGVAFNVADLDRAVGFYTGVLEFEEVRREVREGDAIERLVGVAGAKLEVAVLRLGAETVELREFIAAPGREMPIATRSNDAIFQHVAIVVSDMAAAHQKLRELGTPPASSAPQRLPDWNADAGGIEAYYFRDPDRHFLELIRFPEGKGDPRWQQPRGRLFLGIDHTAIVVDDTERALEFWRDALRLEVVGASENHGVEQERLNSVFGARLRITTLRGGRGMGVELLDYLSPCDGAPAPFDLRGNDLSSTFTLLGAENGKRLESLLDGTRGRRPLWISPGPVRWKSESEDVEKIALSLRDPDRHAVEIVAAADGTRETDVTIPR